MPLLSFNYRAVGSDGREIVDRVEAVSPAAALASLRERGLRDIQLLDDEYSAVQRRDRESARRLQISAKDEIALRRQRSLSARLLWIFGRHAWTWGPLGAWLVYASWRDGWSLPPWPAALLCTFLLWFAWATLPMVLYQQALEASAWCRWSETERWMRWLARWKAWFRIPFPAHEIAFRTATARAGQGHLAEALALVAPLANDPSLAPGFYAGRLVSLYQAARDHRQAGAQQLEAYRQAPSTSTAIDLGVARVRWLDDVAGARELLAPIDAAPLPPTAQVFLSYGRGLIGLAPDDVDEALQQLQQALEQGRDLIGIAPGLQALLFDARAHYGLALARLGRAQEAKAHFNAAYPMLKARGDTALIDRGKAAYRRADTAR